jgi:hypothetical protein
MGIGGWAPFRCTFRDVIRASKSVDWIRGEDGTEKGDSPVISTVVVHTSVVYFGLGTSLVQWSSLDSVDFSHKVHPGRQVQFIQ